MSEFLEDGTFDFSLGQDAWKSPRAIQKNQFAKGVNVTTKGGDISPRQGYLGRKLVFEDVHFDARYGKRSLREIWESGKFQAAVPFSTPGDSYVFTVVSGLIFRTNLRTLKTVLVSNTEILNQRLARVNWTIADGKVVFYDYPSRPIIIDGAQVYRSKADHLVGGDLAPQVPSSIMGAYNNNRLFVANEGIEFTAGDPVGSLLTPEAPITFSEVFTPSSPYINQFFSLSVPLANSPITAMGFIPQLDSSTGIGSLFVSTNRYLCHFKVDQPRTDWEKGQFGAIVLAAGVAGPRAFVTVNSDLVFMSDDGQVRAFSASRNEAAKWGNAPISREVKNFLKLREPELSSLAVLGLFDNRILISANPYRIGALDRDGRSISDYAHGGFVVLEIENLSSFLSEGSPCWTGLWTGVNPMEVFELDGRGFVISKDGDGVNGQNVFYEIDTEHNYDVVRGKKRRVRSIIYSREFDFDHLYTYKRENTIALHLQNLMGQVDLCVERKPSHAYEFTKYGEWHYEAPAEIDYIPADGYLEGLAPHTFREVILGDSEGDHASPLTGEDYREFQTTQLRITIEGDDWSLDNFKLRTTPVNVPEYPRPEISKTEVFELPLQSDPDWLIPEEAPDFKDCTEVSARVRRRLECETPIVIEGPQGRMGLPGRDGARGLRGLPGEHGDKGDKGDQGDPGIQGLPGDKGDKGDQGDPGIQGLPGDKGDKGDQGDPGIQGLPGDKGDKGDQGDPGIQGLPGDKGDKGDQGDPGIQGLPGDKGDKGDQGDPGIQGLPGDKGDKGDQGDPGIQGPPGPYALSTYASKTSDYTLVEADDVLGCIGTFTISLPSLGSVANKIRSIKNLGTGIITIDPSGSELIEGDFVLTLENQYDCATIIQGSTMWEVV